MNATYQLKLKRRTEWILLIQERLLLHYKKKVKEALELERRTLEKQTCMGRVLYASSMVV